MERYKQISTAELFEHILKDDYQDIYFQESMDNRLLKATKHTWEFKDFNKYKWFKREVIK